ncbi:MAG: transporter substrate-binding domain-containing protein [Halopseudomonas aestusnigri]
MLKQLIFMAAIAMAMPANAETLRLATSADYPPWESVNSAGDIEGFDIDVGNAICAKIKAECVWTNQAYDGLLPALEAGQYDVIISAISITDERKKRIGFSAPYAQAPSSFGASGDTFGDIKDRAKLDAALTGKTVGVQGASIFEGLMENQFPNTKIKTYERADQIVADLALGRLDAALMETSSWTSMSEANTSANLKTFGPQLTFEEYPELGEGIGLGFQKDKAKLKSRVDTAIAELLADGTIAQFSQTWFGFDSTP